jgi:hypothetical protein
VEIPPRTVTDDYLASVGETLDVVFDLDLGEVIEGHHVVARGICFGGPIRQRGRGPAVAGTGEAELAESALHYEFVPGLTPARTSGQGVFDCLWQLSASDDAGTEYNPNATGAFDPAGGGPASRGIRNLGGHVPPHASRLTIQFEPPSGWTPPEPWRSQLVIDLNEKRLAN